MHVFCWCAIIGLHLPVVSYAEEQGRVHDQLQHPPVAEQVDEQRSDHETTHPEDLNGGGRQRPVFRREQLNVEEDQHRCKALQIIF